MDNAKRIQLKAADGTPLLPRTDTSLVLGLLDENKHIKTELNADMLKRNTTYGIDQRVYIPARPGYLAICTTAGTTADVLVWPQAIISGVTQLTDGTAVFTIYDCSIGSGILYETIGTV